MFVFTSNSDTTEGRGSTIKHGYTKDKNVALAIVNDPRFYKKFGCMGGSPYKGGEYDVHEEDPLKVYDTVESFFDDRTEDIRKEALAKLTKEEKDVLGLR